jgi:hypothetical protein
MVASGRCLRTTPLIGTISPLVKGSLRRALHLRAIATFNHALIDFFITTPAVPVTINAYSPISIRMWATGEVADEHRGQPDNR